VIENGAPGRDRTDDLPGKPGRAQQFLVDLVGIEPTTSSMPWKQKNRRSLTVKDLKTGRVGRTGAIGGICYQFATNLNQVGTRG